MPAPPRTKEAIIHLALHTFAERGYLATDMEQLLSEAKMSKGLYKYHFTDKAGLLHEIIRERFPYFERILQARDYPDPYHVLKGVADRYIHFLEKETMFWRTIYPLLLSPSHQQLVRIPMVQQFFEEYESLIHHSLQQAGISGHERFFHGFETWRTGIIVCFLQKPDSYPLEGQHAGWIQWIRDQFRSGQ